MTTNKSDFYLQDIDLLRQLEPIMVRKGIEADGYCWQSDGKLCSDSNILPPGVWEHVYRTYRKDSLEAALPGWCFEVFTTHVDTESNFAIDVTFNFPKNLKFEDGNINNHRMRYQDLLEAITVDGLRGQESLKALASLVILLDKEGIN